MKALIQRVKGKTQIASLIEGGRKIEEAFEGPGLVVLLAWLKSDEEAQLSKKEEWILSRVQGLRIFPDSQNKLNLNLADYLKEKSLTGGILWVPQFTLSAKLESGFRPSFFEAKEAGISAERFKKFKKACEEMNPPYKQVFGHFGADMDLQFTNWGPVTIPLEC